MTTLEQSLYNKLTEDTPTLWEKSLYGDNCIYVENILKMMFPETSFTFENVHPVMDDETPEFIKFSSLIIPRPNLKVTGVFFKENEFYFRIK